MFRCKYLGVAVALEEMGDTDEADVIVPHHRPLLILARDLEGILEDWKDQQRSPLRSHKPTLKAFTSRAFLKRFLVAVVRDMPWVFSNPAHRMDLEVLMQSGQRLVSQLTRRIAQFASYLPLRKDRGIFGEFLPRRLRGQGARAGQSRTWRDDRNPLWLRVQERLDGRHQGNYDGKMSNFD